MGSQHSWCHHVRWSQTESALLHLHRPDKRVPLAAQGIVGSTPWNAMVFFTLYLQLLGMSDFAASLLMAVFLGGTAVGESLAPGLPTTPCRLSHTSCRCAGLT